MSRSRGLAAAFFLVLALALGLVLASNSAYAQLRGEAEVQPSARAEDESLILPIRLAARGGNYELAQERLAKLTKPNLVAKGTAVLAVEYARDDEIDKAKDLFGAAEVIAASADVRISDRVSAHLYIARLQNELGEDWQERALENFDRAFNETGKLTGFELDFSLIELAQTSIAITGDVEQTRSVLELISSAELRGKMMLVFGFANPDSAEQ